TSAFSRYSPASRSSSITRIFIGSLYGICSGSVSDRKLMAGASQKCRQREMGSRCRRNRLLGGKTRRAGRLTVLVFRRRPPGVFGRPASNLSALRHGQCDEAVGILALNLEQDRLATGLGGLGDRLLDVAGACDFLRIDGDDDVAGLDAAVGGIAVRRYVGD